MPHRGGGNGTCHTGASRRTGTLRESAEGTESGLVVYTDTGVKGIVRNDTDAMTEWARESFETYRERAEPRDSLAEV